MASWSLFFTTAAAKAVKVIKSRFRFALTGTPIENRLSELWSIFDYLMPGFLFTYRKFKTMFEIPIVKEEDEEALETVSYTHLDVYKRQYINSNQLSGGHKNENL